MKYLLLPLLGLIIFLGTPEAKESSVESYKEYREEDLYIIAVSMPFYEEQKVYGTHTSDYYRIIKQYDWDADLMYKIMYCESSGNPNAHNLNHRTRDNSVGLFQINLYGNLANTRPSKEWLIIPENNISYAYKVWKSQGYNAWRNCYRKVS